ncbi:MAG: ethanolamine utilization protein EutH [Oscillospiraceae bacterium]|nr:ethanolamine utilization protein EutH [Oscillospiraceae bacterium]
MDILIFIFACFALLGAADCIFGSRFGLGAEFERGIQIIGPVTLSMLGMLCLVPVISDLISPVIVPLAEFLRLDPSVFPAMLLANDMGGAPLSTALAADPLTGLYNGLVVSTMMGVTVSFTIPVALKMVEPAYHADTMLGILCGVCTIPVGCITGGLAAGMRFLPLLMNSLPVTVFALLIAFGLVKAPALSVKILTVFGKAVTALIMAGLGLGIFQYLTGIVLLPALSPVEEHFPIFFNVAFLLAGVFPLIKVLSALLKKPLTLVSKLTGINDIAALGLLTSLASVYPTFGLVSRMNRKGIIMNMAFSVSAAFVFGGHLAYTIMYDASMTPAVIIGKLTAGFAALIVAHFVGKEKPEPKAVKE